MVKKDGLKATPWTTTEIAYLRAHAGDGISSLMKTMNRTGPSILRAAQRHRISLRRPNERRGRLLGQLRGVRVSAEIRAGVAAGHIDEALVAERMRIDRDGQLCPCCGDREISAPSGFCRVCHLRRLAAAHLEALEEHDAQRALWTSRKALNRARRAASV